jgi:hypothetical protein
MRLEFFRNRKRDHVYTECIGAWFLCCLCCCCCFFI